MLRSATRLSKPPALRGMVERCEAKMRAAIYIYIYTVFAAHVDNESQWIPDADWSSHSSSSGPVTVSDFHVALRWLQGEHYGIPRRDSGRRYPR